MFILACKMGLHILYSKQEYIKQISLQLLSLFWEYMSSFHSQGIHYSSTQINQHQLFADTLSIGQMVYSLGIHQLTWKLRKQHAYLDLSLTLLLFEMIVGKSVIHHIFLSNFLSYRSIFCQNKHIEGKNQVVFQQLEKYSVFSWHDERLKKQDRVIHHRLVDQIIHDNIFLVSTPNFLHRNISHFICTLSKFLYDFILSIIFFVLLRQLSLQKFIYSDYIQLHENVSEDFCSCFLFAYPILIDYPIYQFLYKNIDRQQKLMLLMQSIMSNMKKNKERFLSLWLTTNIKCIINLKIK